MSIELHRKYFQRWLKPFDIDGLRVFAGSWNIDISKVQGTGKGGNIVKKNLIKNHNIDISKIKGSGRKGNILKQDLVNVICEFLGDVPRRAEWRILVKNTDFNYSYWLNVGQYSGVYSVEKIAEERYRVNHGYSDDCYK